MRRTEQIGPSLILYDASRISQMNEALFEPAHWPGASTAPGYAGGRGNTLFVQHAGQDWVLRHYHRGGLVGRYLNDRFLWTGLRRSRPYREFILLEELVRRGLPVPEPIAARAVRHGLVYSADLITQKIPDVVPLSTRLAQQSLGENVWRRVGYLIGEFHTQRVYHADLTAHNLQINGADNIFLLDFDRGRIMPESGAWQENNLRRLQRSLNKISATENISIPIASWGCLVDAYREKLSAAS